MWRCSAAAATLAVWHPKSARETEVWRFFFSTATRRNSKELLRDYYIRYSGPAGMTEQDDMENWNYAHAASRGTIARRYPYTYEMGVGHAVEEYEWDGLQSAWSGHRPDQGAGE